ncbi:MAG TPA: sulfatase-like hydrolase/transferase, partial [Puia sp.]
MHSLRYIAVPLLLAAILGSPPDTCQAQKSPARKPNIVFILADDLGYGDLQCYGNPYLQTPHINRLAHDGVLLTKYYTPSPLCAPARAALLTGMYNHRTGAIDVPSNRGIDRIALSCKTMGDYFKEAGYATGLIGKWHNGLYDRQYHPNKRGFDHFFGFLNGIQDYYKWNLDLNGTNIPADGRYLTDVITQDALDFIETNRSRPFFLIIAHHAPHVPLEAPDSLIQKYMAIGKGALNKHVATIYAMIEIMDRGIGQVLDKLRDLGLEKNTIVVFTSDNGGLLNGQDNRYENGLSGNKGDVLEEGIRVPAIVSWPGVLPANRILTTPMHGCDWLPTLFSITGSPLRTTKKIDGLNVMELLKGHEVRSLENRPLLFQKNRYHPVAHSDAG